MFLYEILFGKWQLLTRRQILTASAMKSAEGNLEDLESRAFLTAVIPKLLSMLGNTETTSQETSKEPAGNGRFWEGGVKVEFCKSRELFNSCTTTRCNEMEWIVSFVCLNISKSYPWFWIFPGENLCRIFEDLHEDPKIFMKNPQGSSKFLPRSSRTSPRSLRILEGPCMYLEDLCRNPVKSSKILARSLKILPDL